MVADEKDPPQNLPEAGQIFEKAKALTEIVVPLQVKQDDEPKEIVTKSVLSAASTPAPSKKKKKKGKMMIGVQITLPPTSSTSLA